MGHLETGEVAAYLDRVLPPDERDRIEAHLADCAECRREVIEVSRLRHTRSRRSRWLIAAPAAAAAAVALIVFARPTETPAPGAVLRDGAQPGFAVALVAPAESAAVAGGSVTFTWRSAGARVSYRLSVTDEHGDIVWSAASSDTAALLPSVVALRAGRRYFWYVDALLPDGRSMTSDVRQFTAHR